MCKWDFFVLARTVSWFIIIMLVFIIPLKHARSGEGLDWLVTVKLIFPPLSPYKFLFFFIIKINMDFVTKESIPLCELYICIFWMSCLYFYSGLTEVNRFKWADTSLGGGFKQLRASSHVTVNHSLFSLFHCNKATFEIPFECMTFPFLHNYRLFWIEDHRHAVKYITTETEGADKGVMNASLIRPACVASVKQTLNLFFFLHEGGGVFPVTCLLPALKHITVSESKSVRLSHTDKRSAGI